MFDGLWDICRVAEGLLSIQQLVEERREDEVKSICVHGNNIQSIKEIFRFRNVVLLDCSANELTDSSPV